VRDPAAGESWDEAMACNDTISPKGETRARAPGVVRLDERFERKRSRSYIVLKLHEMLELLWISNTVLYH
jgi:hypothetical protein